jgi:hypothetical protein
MNEKFGVTFPILDKAWAPSSCAPFFSGINSLRMISALSRLMLMVKTQVRSLVWPRASSLVTLSGILRRHVCELPCCGACIHLNPSPVLVRQGWQLGSAIQVCLVERHQRGDRETPLNLVQSSDSICTLV